MSGLLKVIESPDIRISCINVEHICRCRVALLDLGSPPFTVHSDSHETFLILSVSARQGIETELVSTLILRLGNVVHVLPALLGLDLGTRLLAQVENQVLEVIDRRNMPSLRTEFSRHD